MFCMVAWDTLIQHSYYVHSVHLMWCIVSHCRSLEEGEEEKGTMKHMDRKKNLELVDTTSSLEYDQASNCASEEEHAQ